MDYSQEPLQKTPFYMTYPMQNLYETEMEYERDMQRMKELYPKEVKRILVCIEDQCDEMEYEGSIMYDESPDRLMIEKLVDRIYEKMKAEGAQPNEGGPEMPNQQMPSERPMMPNQQTPSERPMMPNQQTPSERPMMPNLQMPSERPMMPMTPGQPMTQGQSVTPQMPIPEGATGGTLQMESVDYGWFTPPEGQIPPGQLQAQQVRVMPPPRRPGPGMPPPPPGRPGYPLPPGPWVRPGQNDWMRGLIGVLLSDEMYRRRCRNRRCRRWW